MLNVHRDRNVIPSISVRVTQRHLRFDSPCLCLRCHGCVRPVRVVFLCESFVLALTVKIHCSAALDLDSSAVEFFVPLRWKMPK